VKNLLLVNKFDSRSDTVSLWQKLLVLFCDTMSDTFNIIVISKMWCCASWNSFDFAIWLYTVGCSIRSCRATWLHR